MLLDYILSGLMLRLAGVYIVLFHLSSICRSSNIHPEEVNVCSKKWMNK